jgi:hypothetical protein
MNDFTHKYGKPDVHFDTSIVSPARLAKNMNLTDKHIDDLIDSDSTGAHWSLLDKHQLSLPRLERLASKDIDSQKMVGRQQHLSIDLANKMLSQSNKLTTPLAYNQHLTKKYIEAGVLPQGTELIRDIRTGDHDFDHIIKHGDDVLFSSLANNKLLKPHHIDAIMDKSSNNAVLEGLASNNLNTHQTSKLIDKGDLDVSMTLSSWQPLMKNHVDSMVKKHGKDIIPTLQFDGHTD